MLWLMNFLSIKFDSNLNGFNNGLDGLSMPFHVLVLSVYSTWSLVNNDILKGFIIIINIIKGLTDYATLEHPGASLTDMV